MVKPKAKYCKAFMIYLETWKEFWILIFCMVNIVMLSLYLIMFMFFRYWIGFWIFSLLFPICGLYFVTIHIIIYIPLLLQDQNFWFQLRHKLKLIIWIQVLLQESNVMLYQSWCLVEQISTDNNPGDKRTKDVMARKLLFL